MNKNIILAPESVIDSNGVACGDHLVINSYVEDSNFYFSSFFYKIQKFHSTINITIIQFYSLHFYIF